VQGSSKVVEIANMAAGLPEKEVRKVKKARLYRSFSV
jgi:hypothetical protein